MAAVSVTSTQGAVVDSGRPFDAGNMPTELTSFVGRESELARLRDLHADTRLLTLVGPGGVGKTRLALQLQAEVTESFPDGNWLVDLTPIADPWLVGQAVADVLSVRQQPGQTWLDELTRALRGRRLLLMLDNCAHLLAACGELVAGLLRACPAVHVLATSVQPLGVQGELTWRVQPLTIPLADGVEPRAIEASDAARLFVARVRSHLPDFALNDHNAAPVARICRSLDGLPLALELVAPRVEALGIAEVATRLSDRFSLAVGKRSGAPERQRTLRSALDWSWSLLSDDEQVLLRRLSVFVGGWTLEAAQAACASEELGEAKVVDLLGDLVTKSLVVAEHRELHVRYRLLETVRAYALDQIGADERGTLQARHAAYMLGLAERGLPESRDAAQAALLTPEADNVRAALDWALRCDQADLGLRLAAAAFPLWHFSGHYREGSTWLERLLALPSASHADAARPLALGWNAQLRLMLGDYLEAQTSGQAALDEHTPRGDERGIGLALTVLGNTALQRGDLVHARQLYEEAGPHLRAARSPGTVVPMAQLGLVACELNEASRARELSAELETIGQAWQQPVVLGAALQIRALVASAEGDLATAGKLLQQAVEIVRPTGDQQVVVMMLTNLGHVYLDQAQARAAVEVFAEAIDGARASGERVRLVRALEGYARSLADIDPDTAVRLAGAMDGQREILGTVAWPTERRYLESWLAGARRRLPSTAYQRAWEDGHASTLQQAADLASALVGANQSATSRLLSAREQQVASFIGMGLTNKQIATELVVSPATIRTHVEHILTKLDLRSRAQVAVWASREGLVPDSTRV